MPMRLLIDGFQVIPGQHITDFKGKNWRFRYITDGPISHNKIVVEPLEGGDVWEFFPSVFPSYDLLPA